MTEPTHYHRRIQRATERLAQLQARELLAAQRRESKAKEAAKREEVQRRERLADLAFLAGAEVLEDAELVGALLLYQEKRQDSSVIASANSLGLAHLERHQSANAPNARPHRHRRAPSYR